LAGSGRRAAESQEHSPRIIDLKENSKEPGNGSASASRSFELSGSPDLLGFCKRLDQT
jgi:hypothetical protein